MKKFRGKTYCTFLAIELSLTDVLACFKIPVSVRFFNFSISTIIDEITNNCDTEVFHRTDIN